MPSYFKLFEDTFQRPDENPLDPVHWAVSTLSGSVALEVKSRQAVSSAILTTGTGYLIPAMPNDQYMEVTLGPVAGLIALELKSTIDAGTNYVMELFSPAVSPPGGIGFGKQDRVIGFTSYGSVAPLVTQPGDKIRIESIGNQITFKYNGMVLKQITDTVAPAIISGQPLFFMFSLNSLTDTSILHFEAGQVLVPHLTIVDNLQVNKVKVVNIEIPVGD